MQIARGCCKPHRSALTQRPALAWQLCPAQARRAACQATLHADAPFITSSAAEVASSSVLDTLRQVESHLGVLDHRPVVPSPAPQVVVISGPSGVGKDAVIQRLRERRSDLYFVVTATSRPKRLGEVEGKDYFFVSRSRFEEWVAQDQLLEHAVVYGDYKGIPRQQVDDALNMGTDVVLRIDVQGAATVRALMPGVISVFIAAESEATLVERLVSRKTEQLDKLLLRVQTAREELQCIKDFDYVVVNRAGQLERCVEQISAIIDAEKLKVQQPRGDQLPDAKLRAPAV